MNKLIIPFLLLCMGARATQYKKIEAFGDTLYNIIDEYVRTNSAASSSDVVTFINSDSTTTVFSDGLASGYSRHRVLFEAYQSSFKVSTPIDTIVSGIHDALVAAQQKEQLMNNIIRYSMFGTMGAFTIMGIGLSKFFWAYFRTDRKILHYYKANAHRYVIGNGLGINTTSSIATNTSNSTETNPLVPEPFFR